MNEINFIVNGEIKGKGRPRFSKVGNFVKAYTPKDTENYENKVLMCYLSSVKGTEYENKYFADNDIMVSVSVNAYFTLKKGDYGKKGLNKSGKEKLDKVYSTKHKDLDNIIKSVLDALNNVCYKDDKQVVLLTGSKRYTQDQERLEVSIKKI